MNDTPLWLPQEKSIRMVTDAIADGHRRICLCLPTGGGKTRVSCELIRDWLHVGFKAGMYTNRKMLVEQLQNVLRTFGLKHGTRAAGHEDDRDMPLQISSIQTESSRVLKKKIWQLHDAERILIDEAHLNAADTAKTLLNMHLDKGGVYVGLTATPIGIGHLYDHLIVGGTNSELRACGALVMAEHYGPDEPDTRKVKKELWEYTENDVRKIMQVQRIFGRVLEWFNRLNPEHKPTILFAPGVAESVWFAENFTKRGISAASIDGENCWLNGELIPSSPDLRRDIMKMSKNGTIKVLCNRFVLREGVDAPWLCHGILATIFGSLQSFLQSGGRLLRAYQGKSRTTIQDHGGNWHRHGSLNADRHWELSYTENMVQAMRAERLREKKELEPCRCPKCGKILLTKKCSCGFTFTKKSRPVMMEDGTLQEHEGDIFRPRVERQLPNTLSLWTQIYYRAKNSKNGMTFRQAMGLFFYENHYYPPKTLPYMPTDTQAWFRKVKDVPADELIGR